jgi:hypothetical protein
VVAAQGNRGENVFFVAWNYDADRNLAVIGAVGCIESAAARVEADLSAKVAAESGFKRGSVELGGPGRGWSGVLRHRVQNIFEDAGVGRKGRKESAHEGAVAVEDIRKVHFHTSGEKRDRCTIFTLLKSKAD